MHAIDVVNLGAGAVVTVDVQHIPGPTGETSQTETSPGTTFEFDIQHTFPPTLVQIENLQPGGIGASTITLDGTITNPIGTTQIENERGSILNGPDNPGHYVLTNILEIDADAAGADQGSVGSLSGTRNPIAVILEQSAYTDGGGTHTRNFQITGDASRDLVLDLTALRRDNTSGAFPVTIQLLHAGHNVDLVINDSLGGNDVPAFGTFIVNLYTPNSNGTKTGPLSPCGAPCGSGSGSYLEHFRPDGAAPDLTTILRAFGTTNATVAHSDYTFSDVSAGNDIEINHNSTATVITFTAFSNVDATLHDLDNAALESTSDNSGKIDLKTNGFIVDTETTGDLRVGRIWSTGDDVTLNSPAAVLDAEADNGTLGTDPTTTDVLGRNITITAGNNGIGGISGRGGVGTPNDFLEIQVNADGGALGVLTVTDTAATRTGWSITPIPGNLPPVSGTYGVFMTQTSGDLELNRVVTSGDATLSTLAGSIRDARSGGTGDNTPGDPANVVANNIDLQSTGGSIGDTPANPDATGDDVKIDSSVAVVGRVGLQSDHGIYVTETSGPLNVLFANSTGHGGDAATRTGAGTGDGIRLTTTDTAAQGEDINLIDPSDVASPAQHGKAVLFVQNTAVTIPHGVILAPTAWIMLRSADNVNLGAAGVPIATSTSDATGNTQVIGGLWIDVYGDFHLGGTDPDNAYGTVMTLNGTITPGGGCASEIDPGRDCNVTRLFGNTDSDTINFNQTYLGGRTFAYGSNTPTPFAPAPPWAIANAYVAGNTVTQNGQAYIALKSSTGQDPTQTIGFWSPIPSTTVAPGGDGEDFFNVDQLQTMNVAAGYTLTLDGQGATDTYTVNTTGSQGCVANPTTCHNYVVNALDTGAPTDGVDNLIVDGVNSAQSGDDVSGNPFPADDIFLLRSTEYLASPTAPTTATALADDPGFVALLHGTLGVAVPLPNDANFSSTNASVSICFTSANCNPGQTIVGTTNGTTGTFTGLLAGQQIQISGGTSSIWAGEYTIQSVAADGSSITLTQVLPTGVALTGEQVPTTDVQLTGVTVGLLKGDVTTSDPNGNPSIKIQAVELVNYDTGINGRLTVNGLGGNDAFFVDNSTVTTTLDGGAGNDSFQIGQMYGLTRDSGNACSPSSTCPVNAATNTRDTSGGSLTPADVFGTVATTRGWLSPGNTAPLVAVGGSGDDTFTVYSNQAPLRLEGDDGNDLFVVQAFALAQTTASSGPGSFAGDPNGTPCTPTPYNSQTCQIVWLNAQQLIAMPALTTGFSTAAQSDIRTGSGNNQVEYNMNAPVSVDGGTGFNKLVILGTEYADHIVVTASAIYGAGLSVSYENIQVLEIDALEGDDTIDVLSTSPGVETRIYGGLGSDTINVGGDVVGDVFARDIEGTSGTVNHQVTSLDPNYNGLPAAGVDLSVARGNQGQVVITQSDGFTAVYENGCFKTREAAAGTCVTGPRLLHRGARRSACGRHERLRDGVGVARRRRTKAPDAMTFLLCLGSLAGTASTSSSQYFHTVLENGAPVQVPDNAVVLEFDSTNWNVKQTVFLFAPDDLLPQGNRDVSINTSVLSTDPNFDGAQVTNIIATLYDGDGPGVLVTQLDPTSHVADNVTTVLEGDSTTAVSDLISVQLTSPVSAGTIVVVDVTPADSSVCLTSSDSRFAPSTAFADPTLCPLTGESYTATFGSEQLVQAALRHRDRPQQRPGGPEDGRDHRDDRPVDERPGLLAGRLLQLPDRDPAAHLRERRRRRDGRLHPAVERLDARDHVRQRRPQHPVRDRRRRLHAEADEPADRERAGCDHHRRPDLRIRAGV